jgi:tetratricopeptide (TPR) repeat protein
VNSDADIQKILESVVLYQVDAEKGDGKELAKEFGVSAYPTFAMVDSEGKTIDRWLGYGKDDFINKMGSALSDLTTIEEKQARFQSQPESRTAAALGRYNSAIFKYKEAVEFYRQAQILDASQKNDYSGDIFENMYHGLKDTLFLYEDVSRAADAALATHRGSPERIVEIASMMSRTAGQHKRPDDVAKYLQAGLDATAGKDEPELKQAHAELMVDFSLAIKHDTASAVEYKRASMPDGWMTIANQLNEFAWWCFENNFNLEEAERLSRKSVESAQPGREKANCLDTLAEIVNARGNTREAIDLSKKAVKETPDNKFFQKQVERFEKLLSEKQAG